MKRAFLLVLFTNSYSGLLAQNEVGPDGDKLVLFFALILALIVLLAILGKRGSKIGLENLKTVFRIKRVAVELTKDRIYYPDNLQLKIKNTGSADIDLDRPLMVFDNFWMKRKFRLKGFASYNFYPLYLEKGKTHTLTIDLARFYIHDKKLKKFPKVKIFVLDVKGKKLGSDSVFLQKTLFKF